ncbi:MAG TPA: DUF423 domain-containing protein [Xanthomonadaceae bacterium]|nr:DUF423 domain-containing protein [Xanthomonadaceae bacterium]
MRHAGFSAFGAALVAAGIALGAWAAHGLEPAAARSMHTAALYAMVNGIGLVALGRVGRGRLHRVAAWLITAGVCVFCGTLVLAATAGTSTATAPLGGSVLILGWVAAAVALLRMDAPDR